MTRLRPAGYAGQAPRAEPANVRGGVLLAAAAAGVVAGCAVTLWLLEDPAVEGNAGLPFWLLTLAIWLAAAVVVTRLAAFAPRSRTGQRVQDLGVPLLFGAFVLYLW